MSWTILRVSRVTKKRQRLHQTQLCLGYVGRTTQEQAAKAGCVGDGHAWTKQQRPSPSHGWCEDRP